MSETALVRESIDGGVAVIELNFAPANCYSYAMMSALDAAVLRARMDPAVHVLLLTGEGERFFSAGADIAMLKDADPTFKYYFCLHANETLLRLENTPKLVIAALNGHTVGGGLEIALAADLRVARMGAFKTGLPEVQLGVLPGTGGTQRLARALGRSRAIELMATGRLMDFAEARTLGLINELWECDSAALFRTKSITWAQQFVPPRRASRAIGRIKRAVQSGADLPLADGLALERELQQLLFEGGDAKEGIAAYLDKREPRFEGR